MISKEDIVKSQKKWAEWVIETGKKLQNNEDYVSFVNNTIDDIYGLEFKNVLFKPTKASIKQFRLKKPEIVSYFVGANESFPEDYGFALEPWKEIRFENESFFFDEKFGIAMGNYFFKNASNIEIKVEYTFGYMRTFEEELKIFLHHSSIPFKNDKV